jgi:hypothetical protein
MNDETEDGFMRPEFSIKAARQITQQNFSFHGTREGSTKSGWIENSEKRDWRCDSTGERARSADANSATDSPALLG